MAIIPDFNKTAKVVRPFGGAVVIHAALPVNWVPALFDGQQASKSFTLVWNAWIDFAFDQDVRDMCQRAGGSDGIQYFDGDRVEIVSDDAQRRYIYAVAWVMERWAGTAAHHRRAYLARDHIVYL